MTIHEFGQENDKTIVLIHPSIVMWDYFEYVIPLMEKKYHLVIPAPPGYDPDVKGNFILLSQPQFWVNLNALKGMNGVNLSLGTEVEVSNNFVFNDKGDNDKFYVTPTLAVKWTF